MRTPRLNRGDILRVTLGVTISGFFVWFLIAKLNLSLVFSLVLTASPRWIAAGIILLTMDYLLRGIRWWLMIRRHSPNTGLGVTLCALLAGFAANNLLPLRAGDAIRAFWFNRRLNSSSGFLLGTLVLERMLDLVTLLIIWLIVVTATRYNLPHPGLIHFVSLLIIVAILALAAMFTIATKVEAVFVQIILALFGKRPIAAKIVPALTPIFAVFKDCRPRFITGLILLSGAAWALEGTIFWMVGRALHLPVVASGPWLAFVLGNFAAMIPSAPGYVGTFHVAVISALVAIGCEPNRAASFAVLVHALIWTCVTLAGVFSYFASSTQPREAHEDAVVTVPPYPCSERITG